MIACTFPGKIGDAIYSLPTIKRLCELYSCGADFYTSEYCKGLKNLFEYQSYINNFIIPEEYKIQHMSMGVQPWYIPTKGEYHKVFHLGFKTVPNLPLPEFIANQADVKIGKLTLEYPDFETLDEPYIIVCPRGDYDFTPHYIDFINKSQFKCVVVGAKHQGLYCGIDKTGLDFLESTTWISKAIGFLGISSMFVIADAFNYPKVVFSRKGGLDLRHLTHNNTSYLNKYDYKETLRRLLLMETYSKTMEVPKDYENFGGYAKHIEGILDHFRTIKFNLFRFEHEHRKWEYALVYRLADMVKAKKVLDVGGGGSLLGPTLSWVGIEVTQVDPGEVGEWIKAQSKTVGKPMKFYQKDLFDFESDEKFDVVCSTSVIEHLPNDLDFITKLTTFVKSKGLLILTFDYHPDGVQKVSGHLRTYNKERINLVIDLLKELGFKVFGGEPDYEHFTPDVNGCTFASLVVRKVK